MPTSDHRDSCVISRHRLSNHSHLLLVPFPWEFPSKYWYQSLPKETPRQSQLTGSQDCEYGNLEATNGCSTCLLLGIWLPIIFSPLLHSSLNTKTCLVIIELFIRKSDPIECPDGTNCFTWKWTLRNHGPMIAMFTCFNFSSHCLNKFYRIVLVHCLRVSVIFVGICFKDKMLITFKVPS